MKLGISKLFNLYPGEGLRAFYLLIFGIGVGLFMACIDLGATVLFLDHFSGADLPEVFVYSGLLGTFLASVYAYLNQRVSFAKLAGVFIFIFSGSYLYIYYDLTVNYNIEIIKLAFILSAPLSIVMLMIFQNLTNALYDISQVKRLSKRLSFGLVIGAAAFLFSVKWLHPLLALNLSHYLLFGVLAGFLTVALLVALIVNFRKLNELQVSAQYVGYKNKYRKLLKDKYFLLLSAFVIITAVTVLIVNYSYLTVIHDQFILEQNSQVKLLNFVSLFTGSIIIAAYIIQAFVSQWVIRQYGMRAALLILPVLLVIIMGIAYGVGTYFGYTTASPNFFLFFIIMLASKAVVYALETGLLDPVFKLYFFPISSSLRFDIQSKIEGVVKLFAYLLGGGLLMFIAHYEGVNLIHYPLIVIGLTVIWGLVIFNVSSVYKHLLKKNLDKQQDIIKDTASYSESYFDHLVKRTLEQGPDEMPRYLKVLNILDPILYKHVLVRLLENDDPNIQEFVLQEVDELCLLDAIPVLEKIMESKYFPVLRTSELIKSVHHRLKGAEFRLEKLKYIEQLTLSKLPNERVFGALLTTYADDDMKGKLLNKLFRDPNTEVKYHAITAAAGSDNLDLHNNLVEKLSSPAFSNAAVAAITATGEQLFHMLETAFFLSGQKQKTQLRIVQIYGRIGSERAVELLIKKLNYPNQNVIAEVLNALSKCSFKLDEAKALQIRSELEDVCNTIIWNMSVLLDLKRSKASDLLIHAMEKEIEYNYENIFRLLALIYDAQSVELVKKNINSGDVEEAEFASELLDVFVADEVKPMLIPIINTSQYEEKVQQLKFKFPTEPMEKHEVLVNLIQRDYKWVNRWTKACALRELSESKTSEDINVFAANIVNPDSILRETATEAIYNLYKDQLAVYEERYFDNKRYLLTKETIRKILKEKEQEDADTQMLKFDLIAFLNQVPDFKAVPGLALSEIAKNMHHKYYNPGDIIERYESLAEVDYFVVYEGVVSVFKNDIHYKDYKRGDFIHQLDWVDQKDTQVKIKAQDHVELFKIRKHDLNELMSFYDEIPYSLLEKAGMDLTKEILETTY